MPILRKPSAWLAALALIAGCGPSGTPEDEIRTLVDAAEAAAEERDASALKEFIADDYEDPAGRAAGDVRSLLHGWLVAHQSVSLLTRIDAIELEGTELARVQVTVAMLGRDSDIYHLDLRLALEDGEWRVIRAGWQGGG